MRSGRGGSEPTSTLDPLTEKPRTGVNEGKSNAGKALRQVSAVSLFRGYGVSGVSCSATRVAMTCF